MKRYEDSILDCCQVDPEAYINQELLNGHVKAEDLDSSHEAHMTAQLITECFEKLIREYVFWSVKSV